MSADRRIDWGRKPERSEFLAGEIDKIVARSTLEQRARLTSMYIPVIMEPLKLGGVDPFILERLKIEFLDVDQRPRFREIKIPGNDDLSIIKIKIFDIFGSKILTRLKLSLKD